MYEKKMNQEAAKKINFDAIALILNITVNIRFLNFIRLLCKRHCICLCQI